MPQTFDTQLKNIAVQYIRLLHARVTSTTVQKDLEENAYYPSLLSLHEVFNRYQIDSSAFKVNAEMLLDIDPPFVALLDMSHNSSDFVLVTDMDEDQTTYLYNDKKKEIIHTSELRKRFKDVIWLAELTSDSGELAYEIKRKEERSRQYVKKALLISCIIILLCTIGINIPPGKSFEYFTISLIMLAGLASSCFLLAYEINRDNPFLKNLCTLGAKTNCDAILGSKAAKIGVISWAEIGFSYFAALVMLLLWPGVDFLSKKQVLVVANALASPYIIFSIYYQWQIARQWCPFCISIQLVLALQLVWSINYYWLNPVHISVGAKLALIQFVCLGTPATAWFLLKPFFTTAKDYYVYHSAYKRLQYNPDIFNAILKQQKQIAEGWQELGITIGNPNAQNVIVKVCNPYCSPCAKAHPKLDELIEKNNNICVKIIFSTTNDPLDERSIPVKHLLSIYRTQVYSIKDALDSWYLAEVKDYADFAKKYPIVGCSDFENGQVNAMDKWCSRAGISYTPTIFFNGYLLPENYALEDLKLIM